MTEPKGPNRREFLKMTTAVGASLAAAPLAGVHAAGSDVLKVGLIGCGGRGTGAAENLCEAAGEGTNIKLHALGDLFGDHLSNARNSLKNNQKVGEKFDIAEDRCFSGFDAYQKVIDSGVDLVILATPPGFRPMMIEAAVKAGKHLFTEKPVGVDPVGIRKVLKAAEEAKQKNLAVVAGTQRRHQSPYVECMKRIHDGELGEIRTARCYWNQGGLWNKPRQSSWSDVEWQVRNWLYFTWLSGDHIVEQHVHNIDVVNWALRAHPVKAVALGGRQSRTGKEYGHIYDHFAVDFEYPDGVHVFSSCRQIENTQGNVSEAVVGSKGDWQSNGFTFRVDGKTNRVRDRGRNPYVQEHVDLLQSIRDGKPLNELRQVAESTLSAIMGRVAAYTGKEVTWDFLMNDSQLDTMPKDLAFGPLPVPPVAMPGVTELV